MILFAVFSTIIAISCASITIQTLVGYSKFPLWFKCFAVFFITLFWVSPILIFMLKRSVSHSPATLLSIHILYMMFGLIFILFVILIARDIAWYVLYYIKKPAFIPHPKDLHWLNLTNLIAIVSSIMIFSYSYYEGVRFPTIKEVNLSSTKVHNTFEVVLITDLHINQGTSNERLEDIVSRINQLNPDVVLFVGDMIDDDVRSIGHKVDILKELKPKFGTYFSSGNHELYNGYIDWVVKFSSLGEGFKFLSNNSVEISEKNVFILGIPDTRVMRAFPSTVKEFDALMTGVDEKEYKILMSHAPEVANALPQGMFDLQLSGHTHGGQIFPFHILAKIENKFLAGLYKVDKTDVYVSRGTGYWGPPVRFLAPSEITLIRISPVEQ